jgi:hypothetical protein
MPLLRSKAAVRLARWGFLKVFFTVAGVLAALFGALLLVRVVVG